MKKSNGLSDNEKWQAVINFNEGYDGSFFYGVKTTGIFCRPSCKSKSPLRANVVFFDDAEKAIISGFRPCKRCCPDKETFEPDLDLVNKAKNILSKNLEKPLNLNLISKKLNISTSHFIRLFNKYANVTPTHYITELRIEKAKALLENSKIHILEISYQAGFKSLSNFYKCFKELTGYTPNEYRKTRGKL